MDLSFVHRNPLKDDLSYINSIYCPNVMMMFEIYNGLFHQRLYI